MEANEKEIGRNTLPRSPYLMLTLLLPFMYPFLRTLSTFYLYYSRDTKPKWRVQGDRTLAADMIQEELQWTTKHSGFSMHDDVIL